MDPSDETSVGWIALFQAPGWTRSAPPPAQVRHPYRAKPRYHTRPTIPGHKAQPRRPRWWLQAKSRFYSNAWTRHCEMRPKPWPARHDASPRESNDPRAWRQKQEADPPIPSDDRRRPAHCSHYRLHRKVPAWGPPPDDTFYSPARSEYALPHTALAPRYRTIRFPPPGPARHRQTTPPIDRMKCMTGIVSRNHSNSAFPTFPPRRGPGPYKHPSLPIGNSNHTSGIVSRIDHSRDSPWLPACRHKEFQD